MKKILMLLVGVAALCIADIATATEPAPRNSIVIKGSAFLSVDPDIFYLNFTLDGSQRPIIDQRRDVLDLLKRAKVDIDEQLIISRMTTETKRSSNGTETYLTQRFRLKLSSMREVQLISSTLEKMGIKQQSVAGDYSKRAESERQVRIQAMQNAREQAELLADAVGCQIGECLNIVDHNAKSLRNITQNTRNAKEIAQYSQFADESEINASPDLKFEKISLSYSVEAEFALLSGKAK
ncbi:MAG: SIMPL domain-containing protein [Alistipes sp.]|nr:SIMPL domain-containing protein [Alistipes sp.]